MPSPDPRARWRFVGGLQLVLVVLAAAYAWYFHLRLPSVLPTERDYQALAQALTSESKPDDAVLLFPWWTDRARLYLPQSLRVVGYLGSETDPLTFAPRIWVIAQPNLPRSDVRGFERAFLPSRRAVGTKRVFGNLELSLYENDLYRPTVFTALDHLAESTAYVQQPQAVRAPCTLQGGAFRCPGRSDLRIAAEWHEVFYQPRHCLWMEPPGGASALALELPKTDWGTTLVLRAGLTWDAPFHGETNLTPTRLLVSDVETGQRVARLDLGAHDVGLREVLVEQTPGTSRALKLEVQSDNPDSRWLCVELEGLGPKRGGR